jgi:hypothetical protein
MLGWDDAPTPVLKTPWMGVQTFSAAQIPRPAHPRTVAHAVCVCLARAALMHVTMAPALRAECCRACTGVPVDEGTLASRGQLAWRAHEALQHRNMR